MVTDVGTWLQSQAGQRTLLQVAPPIVAVLLAGLLAALLVRSALNRRQREASRAQAVTAVLALVGAARRGSVATGVDEASAEASAAEGDLRLRLSGLPGAAVAADWARSRVDAGAADVVADRLEQWVRRPRRARRIFASTAPAIVERTAPRSSFMERPAPAVSAIVAAPPGVDAPGVPVAAVGRTDPPGAVLEPETRGVMDHVPEANEPSERMFQPVPVAETEGVPADGGEALPRHSRGEDAPQRASREPVPSWLDTYDDDANVTRDIPLKRPSPVSASVVGERNRNDDGVVPRP